MKIISYLLLLLVLFLIVSCSKHHIFEVPKGNITIVKDNDCLGGKTIEYKPLVINNRKEKEKLINNLNSWILVDDIRSAHKDSCMVYHITWDNHSIGVYGEIKKIHGIYIDGESYIVNGNKDFLDDYEFEQVDLNKLNI